MNATQERASKRPVVFITGANGFIGRALGAYFSDKGFAVRGVDRMTIRTCWMSAHTEEGDLR
jgi:nucleoside-diphosphate-sugar epimerase